MSEEFKFPIILKNQRRLTLRQNVSKHSGYTMTIINSSSMKVR
jgi:hypothetical protein